MRSIKLIPALAAAASLLALAPAQSYARPRAHKHAAHRLHHRHAAVTGACRLTLEAPTVITAGEKAEVFGSLICPGPAASAALTEVTILQRPARRGRRATTFAAKATVEGAAFKFEASPTANTTYVASYLAPSGHYAEDDDFADPATVRKLEEELRGLGKDVEFFTYPGTGHAFTNHHRPEVFHEAHSKTAWDRTIAFFRSQLS